MSLLFRPASPEDAPAASKLIVASGPALFRYFFYEYDERNEQLVEQMFRYEWNAFTYTNAIVAERDGELVAALHMVNVQDKEDNLWGTNRVLLRTFGWFRLVWRLPRFFHGDSLLLPIEEDEWYINHVAVAPEHRGQGIGSALLRHAEEEAKRGGARRISLDVEETNLAARRWYEREGFVPIHFTTSSAVERKVGFRGTHRMQKQLA